MRSLLRVLLLFVFTGLQTISYGQLLPLHFYTTKDGLPSNWITALIQDSRGYLWIGTSEGLSVYDGATFTNYTTVDGLSNNFITVLLESRRRPGTIWIGTTQHGLTKYSDGRFTRVQVGTTPLTNNVISALEGSDGTLWVGTSAGVFQVQHDTARAFLTQGAFAHDAVVAGGRNGRIWIWSGGTHSVFDSSGRKISSPDVLMVPDERFAWIHTDREGDVWVGTDLGVVKVFRGDTLLHSRRLHQSTSGMFLDSHGSAWLHSSKGVLKVKKADFDGGPLVFYGTDEGFPETSTWPVLEDREGNLWFQTGSNGLVKLSNMALERFPIEAGHGVLDSLGHIWVPDMKGVTEVWRADDGRYHSFRHAIAGIDAGQRPGIVLVIDLRGRLYLLLPDGSIRIYKVMNNHRGPSQIRMLKKLGPRDGIPRGTILSSVVDRDNRMWCSIDGAGVLIVDCNDSPRRLALLSSPRDLPITSVRAIFQDRRGDMWLGDYNGGLVVLDGSDWTKISLRHFTAEDGLPDNSIRSFGEDENGRLWIGTRYGGVGIYDAHTFQSISIKDGLISNSIWSMTRDSSGQMWLGTGSGLMYVDGMNPHIFGWTSEMIGSSIAFCTASRDGLVWFGGGGTDLSVYDIKKHAPNLVPPPVYITHVAVNDSSLDFRGRLELPFDRNNCSIQYIGISLKDDRSVQYQYRLNNSDWSKRTKQRIVSLAALSPGDYTFEVRAINSDGIFSESPARISLAILPPFWQKWWFQGLVVLAIVAASLGLMWLRTRQLLAIARVRASLATDLHDDIGSSLTRITVYAAAAQAEIKKGGMSVGDGELSPLLTEITNISRDLVDTMSDIVWSVDPRKDSFEELLLRMKTNAGRMLEVKGVDYDIHISPTVLRLNLSPEIRRNVFLIFKEALNNIVRHSGCTVVKFTFDLQNDFFIMVIEDNGRGFDQGTLHRVNGLKNMRKRAEQLGGNLDITSARVSGTTVQLRARIP